MVGRSWARRFFFASVWLVASSAAAFAQDLEPRAYVASPTGINFLAVVAGRSSGGVLVDPSLPIEDMNASVNSFAVGYGRTFDLFSRTALLVAAAPIVWLEATGRIGEDAARATRTGFADPRIKLSVNLLGGQALTAQEFARTQRRTIIGTSISVAAPVGQYDRTKLINLGANRWAVKPEIGVSHLLGKWTVDGYAGVWLFTENDAFYTGQSRRTQKPIVAIQGHVSYTVKPRLWLAADATWYAGGRTAVDGVSKGDLQSNSRIGATLSLPLRRQQSLKVTGSTGATTRIGANFTTIAAAWQISWLD